jgi:hypothetical protein
MVRPQLTVSPSGIPDPATLIADADFHQSGFVRTLKAEAVLACAVAPAHGPQRWALGSLHQAELSEARLGGAT